MSKNKKTLFLVLGLGLFLSLIPLYNAQAVGFLDVVGALEAILQGLPIRIATIVIVFVLALLALVCGAIFSVIVSLLNWIIHASFLIGITPGNTTATPQVIIDAWNLTRQFVDMLFIIILVFIGLATILKIRDYEAKKILPTLIIIAILINFSGVIVGFIVDMGNIVANFFLKNTSVSDIGDIWDTAWGYLSSTALHQFDNWESWGDLPQTIGSSVGSVIYGLVLIVFYTFSTFVYLILMLLFFCRILILWMVMILAPLAFACYILPATKKFFGEWMQNLIQWSIIGIPIGFFLYFSNLIMAAARTNPAKFIGSLPTVSGSGGFTDAITTEFANLITSLLAPTISLAFLAFGIMLSIKLAPSSASGIINWGTKQGKNFGKWAGSRTGTALGRRISPKIEQWGKRLESAATAGAPLRGFGAKLVDSSILAGVRWAGRGMSTLGAEAYMRVKTSDENEFNSGKKEAANKDSADNFRKVNEELLKGRLANLNRVAGLLIGTRENGDGDDIEEAFNEGGALFSHTKKLKNVINAGKRVGSPGYRPLLKTMFGEIMTNPEKFGYSAKYDEKTNTWSGVDAEEMKKFSTKIAEKMNTQDLQGYTLGPKNFNPDTEAGRFFINHFIENRGADFMPQFARRSNREERDKLMQYIFKSGKYKDSGLGEQWIMEKGADDVLIYMVSSAARGAGVGTDMTQAEVTKMRDEYLVKKTDQELKEKIGRIQSEKERKIEIGETKGLKKLTDRINEINEELELRKRPLQELDQMIETVRNKIKISDQKTQKNKYPEDYAESYRLKKELRRYENEKKRNPTDTGREKNII